MQRWKTVSRRDPDFLAFLDGSFSASERALPVRSLNVGTPQEEITFEIVPFAEIARPSWGRIAWQLIRPPALVLSLGPMIATWLYCTAHGLSVSRGPAASALLGVLLFHIAVNLLNDYGDHIKGQDRLRVKGGSRVIQSGWIRAFMVKRVGWGLVVLAAGFGLSVGLLHYAPMIIVAGLALLAAVEFAFQKVRLKYRGWAEIVAFALTGPLLTTGFAWVLTDRILWEAGALGAMFGAISLMYFHSANFENIMTDSQSGVRTWATRAGFDASKSFFYFTSLLVLSMSAAFVGGVEREVRLLPVVLTQLMALMPVILRVQRLRSPLASELTGLRAEPIRLSWLTVIALVGGYAWMMAGV